MKGGLQWLMRGVAMSCAVFGATARAQPAEPTTLSTAPPSDEASAPEQPVADAGAGNDSGCFPACRSGFVCSNGACVSICNPPCPAGQVCVEGSYCEPQPSATGIYEPPPPPPKAQKAFDERVYSLVGFHMGFGGSVEASADHERRREQLDTTYGANVRTDVPVVRYLVLGPLFQLGSYRADGEPKPARDYYLDVDINVRGRIPIQLSGDMGLQFWAGLPLGLSLSFLGRTSSNTNGGANELSNFGVGYNIGFLLGGAIHFSRGFGMFAETGWLYHRASHDFANRSGDTAFALRQTIVNLGFVLASK